MKAAPAWKKFGVIGFAFFMVKGLAWLALAAAGSGALAP